MNDIVADKNTEMPLFTVIIPAYQSEKTIERTINSILAQSMTDFEIVVIDDGSTDGTEDKVRSFGMKNRIRLIKNGHRGVSAARNTGISEAQGKFILFCDADDEYLPGAFEKLTELTRENNDVTVFGAAVENLSDEFAQDDITPRDVTHTDDPIAALFDEIGARPYVWNSMYNREFLARSGVRFDENFSLGEDQLFQFEALLKASTVRFSSQACYKYYFGTAASCNLRYLNAPEERVRVHLRIVEKVYDLFAEKFGKTGVPGKYYGWVADFLFRNVLVLTEEKCKVLRPELDTLLAKIGKPKGLSFKQKIKFKSFRNSFVRKCMRIACKNR